MAVSLVICWLISGRSDRLISQSCCAAAAARCSSSWQQYHCLLYTISASQIDESLLNVGIEPRLKQYVTCFDRSSVRCTVSLVVFDALQPRRRRRRCCCCYRVHFVLPPHSLAHTGVRPLPSPPPSPSHGWRSSKVRCKVLEKMFTKMCYQLRVRSMTTRLRRSCHLDKCRIRQYNAKATLSIYMHRSQKVDF